MTTPPISPNAVRPDLAAAIAEVRSELARGDAKANTLLTVAGVATTAVISALARRDTLTLAAVAGWIAVLALLVAVIALVLAIRPRLDHGQHPTGFVAYAGYAAADEPVALLEHFDARPDQGDHDAAAHLIGLSALAVAKYRHIRWAVDALLTAGAFLAVAAILAAL